MRDRVAAGPKDDGNGRSRLLRRDRYIVATCKEDGHLLANQIGRERRQAARAPQVAIRLRRCREA
jgi:hypothetical protein